MARLRQATPRRQFRPLPKRQFARSCLEKRHYPEKHVCPLPNTPNSTSLLVSQTGNAFTSASAVIPAIFVAIVTKKSHNSLTKPGGRGLIFRYDIAVLHEKLWLWR